MKLIVGILICLSILFAPLIAKASDPIIDPNACIPALISPTNKAMLAVRPTLMWSSCPDGTGSYEVWIYTGPLNIKTMMRVNGTSWYPGIMTMPGGQYKWGVTNCLNTMCTVKSKMSPSRIFFFNPSLQ